MSRSYPPKGFQIWDLKVPIPPQRTKLFSLKPIGIGTGNVESLSGYISRLAKEYYITPNQLIKFCSHITNEIPYYFGKGVLSKTAARSINGTSTTASHIVKLIKLNTLRKDIHLTTFLPWREILWRNTPLKNKRAWCTACYEEQRLSKEEIYDKLIWAVEIVKVCSIHQSFLSNKCHHCSEDQKPVSSFSFPGFCSKCKNWLGRFDKRTRIEVNKTSKNLHKEFWISSEIGNLLASSPEIKLDLHSQRKFIKSLELLVERLSGGVVPQFAQFVNLPEVVCRRLLYGYSLPSLNNIVNICYPFNLSIVELLLGRTDENRINGNKFNLSGINKNNSELATRIKPASIEEVKVAMEENIKKNPSMSLRQLAKLLGYEYFHLGILFPQLFTQTDLQHRERFATNVSIAKIEKELYQAIKLNKNISLSNILKDNNVRELGVYYYQLFPTLCFELDKRYTDFYLDELREFPSLNVIIKIISEFPPPSLEDISRRFNIEERIFTICFPVFANSVFERNRAYKEHQTYLKLNRIYNKIQDIIVNLEKKGERITENTIKSNLDIDISISSFNTVMKLALNHSI